MTQEALARGVEVLSPFVLSGIVVCLFLGATLYHNRGWWLLSLGWALNGAYLLWESLAHETPETNIGVALAVGQMQSVAFILAAYAVPRRLRVLLVLLAVVAIPWFALASPSVGDMDVALLLNGTSLLPLQIAIVALTALVANWVSGRALVGSLREYPRSSVRLVHGSWLAYAVLQIAYFARWAPGNEMADGVLVTAFFLAMLLKGMLLVGLVRLLHDQVEYSTAHRVSARVTTYNQIAFGWFAHELKNPIGAMRKSAQAIHNYIDDKRVDKARAQCMKLIDLAKTVTSVVNSAKLASEPVRSEDVGYLSINDAVQSAVAAIKLEAGEDEVALPMETGLAANLTVCGVRENFVQCFANLLRNAQEAARANEGVGLRPSVRIMTRGVELPEGRWVEVCISDNGPGIAPDILANIFHPYVSSKVGVNRGLGLYVTAAFVEAFGGTIEVASPVPGTSHGAQFKMRFPRVDDTEREAGDFLDAFLKYRRA